MYKVALLDLSKLSLAKLPTKKDSTLKLYDINYPADRALQIYLHGTVAEPPTRLSQEYGGQLGFKFRPQLEDINGLVNLENVLAGNEADRLAPMISEIVLPEYAQRRVVDKTSYIRLKMKTDKDGDWRFYSDETINKDDESLKTQLSRGLPLTVTLGAGFYFDTEKNKYGLYFDMQELLFNPGQQPVPAIAKEVDAYLEATAQPRKQVKAKKTVKAAA